MGWFVGSLFAVASILIAFVLYVNHRNKKKTAEEFDFNKSTDQDRLDEQRLKQQRIEKRRKEKLRLEQEKVRTTLRKELAPYLQGFIHQNLTSNQDNLKLSEYIIKTGAISLREILNYQTERKLSDGTPYRVGFFRKVEDYELSLTPEELEQLQKYFTDFFVLFDYLQSKGLKINHLGLVDLIKQEVQKTKKIS